MADYDTNKELSSLMYWNVNNLYSWVMLRKLPVDGFKQRKDKFRFDKKVIQIMMKTVTKDTSLKLMLGILRSYISYKVIFHFLPKRMVIEKSEKLVCNLCNKKNYIVCIRTLKQVMNHGLKLQKVHRIIKFHQEIQLNRYIDLTTKLRT